jgi:hypothetical protein
LQKYCNSGTVLTVNSHILYTLVMARLEIIPYSSHLLMGEPGFEIRSPLRILMSQFDPSAYSSSVQNLTTNDNKTQHFRKSFRHEDRSRSQGENAIPSICFSAVLIRPSKIHTRSRPRPVHKSLLPRHLRRAVASLDTRFETPLRTKMHLTSNDSITCISIFSVFVSKCRILSHRPVARAPNFAEFVGSLLPNRAVFPLCHRPERGRV